MPVRPRMSSSVPYRSSRDADHDDRHDVPIYAFDSLAELEFTTEHSARYSVWDPRLSLPIDVLLHPRGRTRLLVGLHGAEAPSQADFPKFQFERSFLQREESSLFLSDPTVLQGEGMSLGWMAGNSDFHAAAVLAEVVRKAAATLDVEETVLVGHSAGGFGAVMIGSMVPHSRAISVNGQSVVDRYDTYTVDALRKNAFPEFSSNAEMMTAYPERLDLRTALGQRSPSSSFTFFSHPLDDSSFSRLPHFPLLAEHFGFDGHVGGITEHGDALVPITWAIDPAKNPSAHALPGTIIPFIDLVLGAQPRMELDLTVDPRWHRDQQSL